MSVLRQQTLRGPAKGAFRGIPLYTAGDVTVKLNQKLDPLEVAMFGQIDETDMDAVVDVEFTPSGEVSLGLLVLFLQFFQGFYYSSMPLFGAIDYPLAFTTRTGEQITLVSAALTGPPSITCAGGKILFGSCKFTGIRQNGASWATANSMIQTQTGQSYPSDVPSIAALSGTSNANPNVFTTAAAHGFVAGQMVTGSGSVGDTSGNGVFTVATAPTTTTFTLYKFLTTTPVAGNGEWESGGTFTGGGFNALNILRQPFMGKWLTGALPKGTATATEASPAVFDLAAHGLVVGDTVVTSGYTNDALNGTFTVATVPTSGSFTLTGVDNTVGADSGKFIRTNLGDTFACFDTEAGFTIEQQVTVTADKTDNLGTFGMYFEKAMVSVKAIPVGPSIPDAVAMAGFQGAGAGVGRSAASRSLPLYLSAAGIYIKLNLASLQNPQINYGVKPKRLGTCEWHSQLSFNNGPQPLLQVSLSPIA